jgi:hypothetical protein
MEGNSKMINDTNTKSIKNSQISNSKDASFSRSCIWLEADYNQLMLLGLPENLKNDYSSTFRRTDTQSKKNSLKQSQTPILSKLQRQKTSFNSTQSSSSSYQRKGGRVHTLVANLEAVNENNFEIPSSVFNNSSFEAEKTDFTKKNEVLDTDTQEQDEDRPGFILKDFGENSQIGKNKEIKENYLDSSLISDCEFDEGFESDSCKVSMMTCRNRINESKSKVFLKLSKVIQDLNSDIRRENRDMKKFEKFIKEENDEWTIIEGELEPRESFRNSYNHSACCTKCYIF